MDSNQTRLVSILVITVIVASGAMAALVFFQPAYPPIDNTPADYSVFVVGGGGISQNVTLAEMMLMENVTGMSSYQNTYGNVKGVGEYTGVKVSDLLDLVGGVDEGFVVRVISSDGYSQTFEKSKVYPNSTMWDIQGDMILAYEFNGTVLPEYEDGIRLAFLPEDGYYSNADANATTDPNPAAAGPQWVSNVVKIEVLEILYTETFDVSETLLRTLPSVTGEGGYRDKGGDIYGPFNLTGVSVITLLEEFVIIPDDYIITFRSSDGYTSEFSKSVVDGAITGYTPTGDPLDLINSTMVIAYEQDGVPLVEGGPLRLVFLNEDGNLTDGRNWAKDVVSITILEKSSIALILSNYILSQQDNCPIDGVYILNEKWPK